MPTVVVTGASGFLGRYVTAQLRIAGMTVIPVSRKVLLPGGARIADYCDTPEGDVLIHLAEEADRSLVNRMGEAYTDTSLGVLKALALRGWKQLVYASSGVVYGHDHTFPCTVDTSVIITDSYSQLKVKNENVVLDAGGCVVRLSNLIGEGMSTHNVVSDILSQIRNSGPLLVRDDQPVRDYLAAVDAANAFVQIIQRNLCVIVNVGSGIGTSVRQLAELALNAAGQSDREIRAISPSTQRSNNNNVLDISKTVDTLGWSPSLTLNDQLVQLRNYKSKFTNG